MGRIGQYGTWKIPSLLAPPMLAVDSDIRVRVRRVCLSTRLLVALLACVRWFKVLGLSDCGL